MRISASTRLPSSSTVTQSENEKRVVSLGVFPVRRGLAEEFGAIDPFGRGFSLNPHRDLGLDVTGWGEKGDVGEARPRGRAPLPPGHRFFHDCLRETKARMIEYSMTREKIDSLFVTLTFKDYLSERKSYGMLRGWLTRMEHALDVVEPRGQRLKWVVAQEWQIREVIHFHLILHGVRLASLSRKRWESRWEGIGGGFARIHDAVLRAAPYLAKYCGKNQGGDLRWEGAWRGIEFPRSTGCCET